MAKFRKKPVVIHAEQFNQDSKPWPEGVYVTPLTDPGHERDEDAMDFRIDTLEGPLHVSEGDWIITGIKGERYPCKPDVFEATYESIDSVDAGPSNPDAPPVVEREQDPQLRKIEVWDPSLAHWTDANLQDLRKGQVFRMFEPGATEPLKDPEGHECWICMGDGQAIDGPEVASVQSHPIPGFEAQAT